MWPVTIRGVDPVIEVGLGDRVSAVRPRPVGDDRPADPVLLPAEADFDLRHRIAELVKGGVEVIDQIGDRSLRAELTYRLGHPPPSDLVERGVDRSRSRAIDGE